MAAPSCHDLNSSPQDQSCFGRGICYLSNNGTANTNPEVWKCNCTGNFAVESNYEITKWDYYKGADKAVFFVRSFRVVLKPVVFMLELDIYYPSGIGCASINNRNRARHSIQS